MFEVINSDIVIDEIMLESFEGLERLERLESEVREKIGAKEDDIVIRKRYKLDQEDVQEIIKNYEKENNCTVYKFDYLNCYLDFRESRTKFIASYIAVWVEYEVELKEEVDTND